MRLGADPEVFLQNMEGRHISALGLIGADKWNPLQMEDLPQGFTIQEDNVAMEFGIPPAATADEFVSHIQRVMRESLKYVYTGLSFSKLSCTLFDKDQLDHPLAFCFGCEPDWNAWTGEENKKPSPPDPQMRSAGGHIHVETQLDAAEVVRRMDLFLSIPAVLMDNGYERKQIYGKAGAFRKKPYGVEYRTPSNFWIFDEKLIRWVWKNTEQALAVESLEWNAPWGDRHCLGDDVQAAINNNDKVLAEALIKEFQLEVV
jgi:hypothetical protein